MLQRDKQAVIGAIVQNVVSGRIGSGDNRYYKIVSFSSRTPDEQPDKQSDNGCSGCGDPTPVLLSASPGKSMCIGNMQVAFRLLAQASCGSGELVFEIMHNL